ncbi:hypothetical protein Q5752_005293 [Cryptotrichosporon argae]
MPVSLRLDMAGRSHRSLVAVLVTLLAVLLAVGDFGAAIDRARTVLHARFGGESLEHHCSHAGHRGLPRTSSVYCPVQPANLDVGGAWDPASDADFVKLSHHRLQGAIQIRTETFDDMSFNASDLAFDVFYDFEAYLRKTFPLFHAQLSLEHVNVHGLLFTWQGSRPDLQPILLMAHQDVVPVNPGTIYQWTQPPFSGLMDSDGWIWGRGTTDMKSTLVALLASTEKLLEQGFVPERTILYSFGFDEEIGGPRGAGHLAPFIEQRYGTDGIAMIVDEGFTGVDVEFETSLARVGVAEKGCMTLSLSVLADGGHSSRPPAHTAIGIMSRLLVELENNPTVPRLVPGNPLLSYLECAAEHGSMDVELAGMVRQQDCWPLLAAELGKDRILSTFLKTTQAIDVVNGGIKYNALPEAVTALTNYRIDFFESTQDTVDKVVSLLRPLVETTFNMTWDAFGSHAEVTNNVVRLEKFGLDLEPAPLTPAEGKAWELMGGTIKHLFPGTVIVPSAMTAFTDTRHCWALSKHIYRFVPASLEHILNYHTVNERIHIHAHMSTIRFFYKFLHNSIGWQAP